MEARGMLSKKRLAICVVGALVGLISVTGPAYAHPKPTGYSPGDGATLSSPPSEAWAEFDEHVTQGTLEVYDPCGERVDQGNSEVLINRVSVGVSAERAGTYTAVWTVVGQDSHKVSGDWSFTVTDGPSCPGEDTEPEPKDEGGGSGDTGKGSDDEASSGDTTGPAVAGSSDDEPSRARDKARADKNNRKKPKKGKHAGHKKKSETDPSEERSVELISQSDERVPNSGEIPLDWLLISFAIAALIGAAGGRIYVDLTGPRDHDVSR